MKHIDLSDSQNLIETPDLSGIPNLEELKLSSCTSLSKVHPSIGFLRQLKLLHLQHCKSLERLADEMRLESLEYLNLFGCSRLNRFPGFVGHMTSLISLYLGWTGIKELPLSFKSLSSLVNLDISYCSRLEKIPKNMIGGMKHLESLFAAGSGSDLISLLMMPNSLSSLSSLTSLSFSNCNLSDGAIPNDLCCLSSLKYLNLSGNQFTRIPDIWQLSKLVTLNLSHYNLLDGAIPNDLNCLFSLNILNLSYCNLLDGAIPNDLSGMSSLHYLNLSGNNFTRIPDSVAQLSALCELNLEDCSRLRVLPKLPLRLTHLRIKACPLLKMFYDRMDVWTSNEILRSTDCSFVAHYIDYECKPHRILYLHPQNPSWIESIVSLLLLSFLTH